MASLADLRRWQTLLDTQWNEAHDVWGSTYLPLLRRELPQNLSGLLGDRYRFPVQSPDLEGAAVLHKQILTMNLTQLDLRAAEHSEKAKKTVEKDRIWLASWYNKLNADRWLDEYGAEGVVKYGLSVVRACFHLPPEPKDSDLEPYYEKQEEAGKERDEELAREEYFKDCAEKTMYLKPVNPLTFSMGPNLSDPDLVCEYSIIKGIEIARGAVRSSRGRISLNDAGKLFYLGEGESFTGLDATSNAADRNFRLLRVNYREDDKWYCCEYLHPEGDLSVGEELNEYKIPFGRPEYYWTGAGQEALTEQNPFKRFRPMMFDLYCVVNEENFWHTLQTEIALMAASGGLLYIDASRMTEQAAQYFSELGMIEGTGARSMLKIEVPKSIGDEIPIIGGTVQRFPNDMNQYMIDRLVQLERDRMRYMPNRFLTGQASEEAREATGTAFTLQQQQARLPYGATSRKLDGWKRDILRGLCNLVLYGDEGVEPEFQKQYPMVTTGDEPLVRGKTSPGETYVVKAEDLKYDFDIYIYTKDVTLAEQAQLEARAWYNWERGAMTSENLMEELGKPDPMMALEEIDAEATKVKSAVQFEGVRARRRMMMLEAMTGINMAAMSGGGMAPGGPGAPGGVAGAAPGGPPPGAMRPPGQGQQGPPPGANQGGVRVRPPALGQPVQQGIGMNAGIG